MATLSRPRPFASRARGKPAPKKLNNARAEKRKQTEEDINVLQAAVDAFDPKTSPPTTFADLPLSTATASGLCASHFTDLTDVQASAIPLALKDRDVLGAAKTGSGKTLAFLVPVLEKLHRARWTDLDGLGALIVSPTRELAVQIFDVLRKVGRNHTFSAGLVIGGKSLKEEAERLARMNILVCTPGRMLQHLDQTAGLDVDNLQMLVLDEADRIMDMGFQTAVDALVEHLPRQRQTLMFSATQSRKVSDLARLSLKDPEYVSVHEAAAAATPSTLQQHYITAPLADKLDTLYGFIKANLKSKMIVFLSSGKQVRFVYESFRNLQPGIPLLHLHGRQKQLARLEITSRFVQAQHACLLATDVVARGVDFPAVDWVIQVDCPEDVDTYIHRVGRTARYERAGRAVLFLDPSEEEGMLKRLGQKKVPIQRVNVREKKRRSIKDQLQVFCFQNSDLKYLGQKAFVSYARSIHLQRDKEVFKLDELDLDGFAVSMGLPGTPQIRYQKGEDVKKLKNAPRALLSSGSEMDDSEEEGEKQTTKKKTEVRTKYDRMFERTNQDVLSSHYTKLIGEEDAAAAADNDNDDACFLSVKRHLLDSDDSDTARAPGATVRTVQLPGDQTFIVDSKRREKMLKSKKKMLKYAKRPDKIVFDDEGNPRSLYEMQTEQDFAAAGPAEAQRVRFVADETAALREADVDDKMVVKQKKREKKEKRRAREALERGEMAAAGRAVERTAVLGADADEEDPLALLRSLPLAGRPDDDGDDDDGANSYEKDEEEVPRKQARKWFQRDSDDDDDVERVEKPRKKRQKKGRREVEGVMDREPEDLEDLEALATGLLDG